MVQRPCLPSHGNVYAAISYFDYRRGAKYDYQNKCEIFIYSGKPGVRKNYTLSLTSEAYFDCQLHCFLGTFFTLIIKTAPTLLAGFNV